jgi:hypothetical protein
MADGNTSCNFLAPTVIRASYSTEPVRPRWRRRAGYAYRHVRRALAPPPNTKATDGHQTPEAAPRTIRQGDLVEVKSLDEIRQTLDGGSKYLGLKFMPEMERYCGQRMRVFKEVATIKLEDTGEVRLLKSPTVFLEGAQCDGERHSGCGRACFHFWKEGWLRRISEPEAQETPSAPPA